MTEDLNMIDAANQAAKRIEEANKVMEALVKKQEAIEARRLLGGETSAGQAPEPEMSKDEKDKLDMKAYFKGTAIEGALQ